MLPSFRVPTPAPRGCGRAPIVNSVPAGGARLRGGGGVAAPTGRPEAIHGTFYDLLVAGTVFKVFKDVGQRGGDTAPFAQVVALAAPWMRGRRPKGPETKLENFENRGAPSFDNFQRSAPGRRAGGDILGNFENGGHRLAQRFSKSGLRPLGSGGRNSDAKSVPSAKAPIYVRPIAMALTGSLTVERRFL
jgi:hypothetical protein